MKSLKNQSKSITDDICNQLNKEFDELKRLPISSSSIKNEIIYDNLDIYIYKLSTMMKQSMKDHLLITTCIHILINVFDIPNINIKAIQDRMLVVGIQGILFTILNIESNIEISSKDEIHFAYMLKYAKRLSDILW